MHLKESTAADYTGMEREQQYMTVKTKQWKQKNIKSLDRQVFE